jgi:hypothetical protein
MNRDLIFIALLFLLLVGCGGGSGGGKGAASTPLSSTASSASNLLSSANNSASSSAMTGCGAVEVSAVFERNNCLLCHSATSFETIGGGLDLATGNVGRRLLGRATHFGGSACQSELLIDPVNANNSLILKLIDSTKHASLNATACKRNSMPQTGGFMPAVDLACVETWVANVVKTEVPVDPPVTTEYPFSPADAGMALRKAKTLLHGGAPTEAELTSLGGSQVSVDKAALIALIVEWEKTPEYKIKIQDFLSLELQQKNISTAIYKPQFQTIRGGVVNFQLLRNNFEDMFVRTAWNIVDNDQDFREVVTTRQWQVTTAILAALVYTEKQNQTPGRTYLQRPQLADFFSALAHLTTADYSDWRTVNVMQATQAASYENTAAFVESLRTIPDKGSIALLFPRVGFFSTPVFFDYWTTNDDNSFRVTTQQSLIVALNKAISTADSTPHLNENGIPPSHIDSTTTCYQCHVHLDPMRLVFSNYQVSSNRAKTPSLALTPSFSFLGVSQSFVTVDDFAKILSDHPEFSKGWVQKLCVWGNSTRCDESDPEYTQLVSYFTNNGYNLRLLFRQFFSSPIFTGSLQTQSHKTKDFVVSLARSNHFCRAMDARLQELRRVNGTSGVVKMCVDPESFGIVPRDEYSRGAPDLIQSVNTGLFDAKSIDQECSRTSKLIFANDASKIIDMTKGVDQAIAQITQTILAIPSNHHRYAAVLKELKNIYTIANHPVLCAGDPLAQGENIICGYKLSVFESLKSVWFSACTSPEIIGLGL